MKIKSYLILLSILLLGCRNERSQSVDRPVVTENLALSEKKLILFFGNSLTAGYGIEEEDAFPGLVAKRIDSLGLDYRVINAGLSGETTASGLSRLDWFLEEKPDIFLLELGGNDGLRGIAVSETKKNLKSIIQLVKSRYPETTILLGGMQIPPNMGPEYTANFQKIFPEVAEEEDVTLIPFLLEGVAGNKDLNLPDGIHPTEEGHQIIFHTIWSFLEQELK
jgi:acyl-CoA thioesterase I